MLDDHQKKEFLKSRILAIVMLVTAPILWVVVALILEPLQQSGGEFTVMFYILLILAIVEPVIIPPLIERYQITRHRQSTQTRMSPAQLFTTIAIIKAAFVDAVYIFGFIVFFLSGDVIDAMWFAILGVIWSVVYWPREQRFEQFLQKVETP